MKKESLNKFVRWHKQQFSRKQKIISLAVQGVFFLILSPLIIFFASGKLDTLFAFSGVLSSPVNLYLGLLFFIAGLFLSFWAVWVQLQIGQGTPAPMMPTQKLVIKHRILFAAIQWV